MKIVDAYLANEEDLEYLFLVVYCTSKNIKYSFFRKCTKRHEDILIYYNC
jgi:hypothetical protein